MLFILLVHLWYKNLNCTWNKLESIQLIHITVFSSIQRVFSSVQSLSHVQLFVTPWITARQASQSITISQSSLRLTSIELVMPSSHLILCRPLFLLPPAGIRVFSNESTLHMRWPKYWSFSFSISLSMNTQDWSPLGLTGWISLPQQHSSKASILRCSAFFTVLFTSLYI